MSAILTWHVGNRKPSITEQLTYANGDIVDLTTSTVRFKMRKVGVTTPLKVDQPATIVGAPTNGNVRYDWAAIDVDTEAFYLCWWEVTTSGQTQDLGEALIEFRAHAPELNAYVELEELKSTAELTGTSFADQDIQSALVAASRGIDAFCNRRFYLDADANQVRHYSPTASGVLRIDDLVTKTSVQVDKDGDGTFEDTWVENTDFVMAPVNAPADGRPWTRLEVHPLAAIWFPPYPRSVKITGRFGWNTVPSEVRQATTTIATRLLMRARQAPFGVVSGGIEGEAIRIAQVDPDLRFLLGPLTKIPVY